MRALISQPDDIASHSPSAEISLHRAFPWIVLLELDGWGVYPWHWTAKPVHNGMFVPHVLGFSNRTDHPTRAVFQARDMLEGHGITDYQIHHVPALRRHVPYRWPQPRVAAERRCQAA